MNDYTYVKNLIKQNEGYSDKTYLDSKNIPTIGYGYNLLESFSKNEISKLGYDYNNVLSGKQTLSPSAIDILLDYSINRAVSDASKFVSNFNSLNPERQSVLIDMSFNLGGTRLNKFKNLKAAIENEDWDKASNEIIDSKYYVDVKNRAKNNAEIMKGKSSQTQQSKDQSQTDTEYINNELNKDKNIPEIDKSTLTANSDQIKTDGSSNYFVDEENKTIYYFDENGNPSQITYDDNSDLQIFGDPTNPNKIAFTDENGDYQVWEKDENGNFVQTNKTDYSQVSNTAINQIGSLIIANNENFSNIEKIVVSSSVGTVADFATYSRSDKDFSLKENGLENLQGAVVGFAVSSYFAHNDNISDILNIDGTLLGGIADFALTFSTAYVANNLITNQLSIEALNSAFSSSTNSVTGVVTPSPFSTALGGAVGAYLGSSLANEIMDWDTKAEAIGSTIGSAVGAVVAVQMAILLAAGPVGWAVAALYAFGGSFVGNIVGGVIGGVFGGSKPPPPTANAQLEFDEENLEYKLTALKSSDGGNKEAMKNIAESLGKYLVNTFTLPGGQLIDDSLMPDINVNQNGKNINVNGYAGTFADAQNLIANVLSVQMPFINVENGDEYVLRAMNRTNEKFLSGNPDDLNRVNLNELYTNISLAKEYSNYVNQNLVKDYVDNLLLNNDPKKIDEINHWKEVFNAVKELNLDKHHYSEDFNKLNSEIAKYNYDIKEQNNQLLNIKLFNLTTKKRQQIIYNIINKINQVNNSDFTNTKNLLVG